MTQQIIKNRMLAIFKEKRNSGELPTGQQLDQYYLLFRGKNLA
jgi:hypothetical protein